MIYRVDNGKPIDLMVTAAQAEYDSIVSQGSQYMLTRRQVMLSGFPRHDALLSKTANRKTILIMPTWRTYLCGEVVGKGNTRVISHAFEGSTYARAWEKLLSSDTLKRVSEENQMPIAFFPHSNMFPYIEAGELKVPDYVEVLGNQREIQSNRCLLMLLSWLRTIRQQRLKMHILENPVFTISLIRMNSSQAGMFTRRAILAMRKMDLARS